MSIEYKIIYDNKTGKELVEVEFSRKWVKIDGRKCSFKLLYPSYYFDARFYTIPSPGSDGQRGMCYYNPLPEGITLPYKCVRDCIDNLWWIGFDEWFSDVVVLKTDYSKMGLPDENHELYKIYNRGSLNPNENRFKSLAMYVLKANVTDAESERKLIAMLEFLILNWCERLTYVDDGGWTLFHFAAKYASPNIMRALIQLADKFYGDNIKPLYSSSSQYGKTAIILAKNRTDGHRGEIISLLEKYSIDFLIEGLSAEAKVMQAVVVLKELVVLHDVECQSLIDLFKMI
jgi:hypothetical protein